MRGPPINLFRLARSRWSVLAFFFDFCASRSRSDVDVVFGDLFRAPDFAGLEWKPHARRSHDQGFQTIAGLHAAAQKEVPPTLVYGHKDQNLRFAPAL